MNCSNQSPFPVFSIFQGDSKTMNLAAVYDNFGGPVDLTSCAQIVITLPNADGTFLILSLTESQVAIGDVPVLGLFSAGITSDQSQLLNPGELQNFTVTFTISGMVFTVPYVQSLSVFETEP